MRERRWETTSPLTFGQVLAVGERLAALGLKPAVPAKDSRRPSYASPNASTKPLPASPAGTTAVESCGQPLAITSPARPELSAPIRSLATRIRTLAILPQPLRWPARTVGGS